MDHRGFNAAATDLELDDALARAVRQLIAEAVEAAGAAADAAAAESELAQLTA